MLQAAATSGSIHSRYTPEEVVIFEIASRMSWLEWFQETFGMQYVGLADPGQSAYQSYRVPDPEAPYPQDVIIDQEGRIAHWSWEYDPQELIDVIDYLLTCGCTIGDEEIPGATGLRLSTPRPSLFRGETRLTLELPRPATVKAAVTDVSGRLVRILLSGQIPAGPRNLRWNGLDERGQPAASGVYYINLVTEEGPTNRRVVLLR